MRPARGVRAARCARGALAAALLLVAACAALSARAQGAAPGADPPTVAGRLSWRVGEVRLRAVGSGPETLVSINWPLTSGDVLSTGPSGRAEVWVGATALRLDVGTRLSLERVDAQQLDLRLEQGTLALRVATPDAARQTRVASALGRFAPQAPGAFRIDVGSGGAGAGHGAASVWQGRLAWQPVVPGGAVVTVVTGQRVESHPLEGSTPPRTAGPPADDEFARFVQQRDAAFAGHTAARYVSPVMTGIEDLDPYGHWSEVAEYGTVWWPHVGADWVPYRHGRWVRVAPWGWTWIADEPWGFAPFHYGRWVRWQGRWGWVPGRYVAQPVYAPALVGWTRAADGSGPPAGWFPLAPREAIVPHFAASADFLRRLNASHAMGSVVAAPQAGEATATVTYRYQADAAARSHARPCDGAGFSCNAGRRR